MKAKASSQYVFTSLLQTALLRGVCVCVTEDNRADTTNPYTPGKYHE